jgi:hypothetical protein
MDSRAGTVEDLPPLELQQLRELDLAEASAETGSTHLASASGIVCRGDFAYVIGDELLHLGVFRLSSGEPGQLVRVLQGDVPADVDRRKAEKADLEALAMLPPSASYPYGAILGLGSGSGAGRDRGFACALVASGALDGEAHELDLAPLYELLRSEIGGLNIEGACVMGGRLWLLNRGNGPDRRNAVAELSLEDVVESTRGDLRIDPQELAAIREYDLGELAGVDLNFSDATPVADDMLVFTASAEGDGREQANGEIRGSVVGTIDLEGHVLRLRTIDRRYKVEGVHASVDTGVADFLFVCDQDDDAVASPLLSATMPLDAATEG